MAELQWRGASEMKVYLSEGKAIINLVRSSDLRGSSGKMWKFTKIDA